jgi:hypothetical protein
MPFLLNEDAALKTLIQGITVADAGNSARPVPVYYGQPDKEIRQQSYPYITLEIVGIKEDFERAHRGYVPMTYVPEGLTGYADPTSGKLISDTSFPIPVDIFYQVTTWSRQPRHDRQLIAALFAQGRLPFRFGQLHIPEDNTLRRLDMLGFSKRDTTESGKRLFSNVYNIRVSAELFPDIINQVYQVLSEPNITYTPQFTTFDAQINN